MTIFGITFQVALLQWIDSSLRVDRIQIEFTQFFRIAPQGWYCVLLIERFVRLHKDVTALLSLFVLQVECLAHKLMQADRVEYRFLGLATLTILKCQLENGTYESTHMVVGQLIKLLARQSVSQEAEDFHVSELDVILTLL